MKISSSGSNCTTDIVFHNWLSRAADPVLDCRAAFAADREWRPEPRGDTKVCFNGRATVMVKDVQCESTLFSPVCWHWV